MGTRQARGGGSKEGLEGSLEGRRAARRKVTFLEGRLIIFLEGRLISSKEGASSKEGSSKEGPIDMLLAVLITVMSSSDSDDAACFAVLRRARVMRGTAPCSARALSAAEDAHQFCANVSSDDGDAFGNSSSYLRTSEREMLHARAHECASNTSAAVSTSAAPSPAPGARSNQQEHQFCALSSDEEAVLPPVDSDPMEESVRRVRHAPNISCDRRGLYDRSADGVQRRVAHADQAAQHLDDINKTALAGACTNACPFSGSCLYHATRFDMIQCHEFSYGSTLCIPGSNLDEHRRSMSGTWAYGILQPGGCNATSHRVKRTAEQWTQLMNQSWVYDHEGGGRAIYRLLDGRTICEDACRRAYGVPQSTWNGL